MRVHMSVRPCTKWASDQSTAQAPRPITVHNADRARPELDKAAPMARNWATSHLDVRKSVLFAKLVATGCVLMINSLLLSFFEILHLLCFGRHPSRAITSSQQKCQCDACRGTNRHKQIQVLCSSLLHHSDPPNRNCRSWAPISNLRLQEVAMLGTPQPNHAKPCQVAKSSLHAVATPQNATAKHFLLGVAHCGTFWHQWLSSGQAFVGWSSFD